MRFNIQLLTLAAGALIAMPSFASTLVLGVDGAASVGADYISFGTTPTGGPFVAAPGTGQFMTTLPIGGVFAANGVTSGEIGNITSLDKVNEPAGVLLATPVQFMTFSAGGSNLTLFLTELAAGPTPGSPFNLTTIAAGSGTTDVIAAFAVDGYIWNSTDSSKTSYTGTFSATFDDTTIADLVTNLPQTTPFSGTFSVTTTPEPASLLLAGLGLLGAGLISRRKVQA